jgi:hypothetical protein
MENRPFFLCLIAFLILLSCGSKKEDVIMGKFDKEECKIDFDDLVYIDELKISQSTMFYGAVFKPLENKKSFTNFQLCVIDTNIFDLIEPGDYSSFNNTLPFFVVIKLRSPKTKQAGYYRSFFEKGIPTNDTPIKFEQKSLEH